MIQLKENTGMSWKKLSDYHRIPYRTLQDWYMEKRRIAFAGIGQQELLWDLYYVLKQAGEI